MSDELREILGELRSIRELLAAKKPGRKAKGVKPATLAEDMGVDPRTIVRAIKAGVVEAKPCGAPWSIPRAEAERIKRDGLPRIKAEAGR